MVIIANDADCCAHETAARLAAVTRCARGATCCVHVVQVALLRFKKQVKGATVSIEQDLPAGKTYLFPNPALREWFVSCLITWISARIWSNLDVVGWKKAL